MEEIETVIFAPAAWDIPGPVDVVVTTTAGESVTLFRYYPDELSFTAADFIGRTVEEAKRLHHQRDLRWLRS